MCTILDVQDVLRPGIDDASVIPRFVVDTRIYIRLCIVCEQYLMISINHFYMLSYISILFFSSGSIY